MVAPAAAGREPGEAGQGQRGCESAGRAASFGAGPVTILISNQSHATQRVTFETASAGASPGGITESSPAIRPMGTATLQVNVPDQGIYSVHVESTGIQPAQVKVGRKRPSSQNDLLLP